MNVEEGGRKDGSRKEGRKRKGKERKGNFSVNVVKINGISIWVKTNNSDSYITLYEKKNFSKTENQVRKVKKKKKESFWR